MTEILTGKPLGRLPEPLGDVPGLAIGDRFYVLGGASGQEFRDKIWEVNPDNGECTEVGRLPYAARGHQVVAVGDSVYLLGGFDGETRADLWRLSPDFSSSEQLSPMPQSNAWFAATEHEGKIAVVGGFSIPAGYSDRVMTYDPAADRWEAQEKAFSSDLFPKQKIGANALASFEGALMSFGGADEFNKERGRSNALGLAGRYNLRERSWEALPQTVAPREGLVVARRGKTAFLIGGMAEDSEEASRVVEKVSLADGRVEEFGRLSTGRLTPAASVVGSRLIVAGGVTQPLFEMTHTIEYFDLSAEQ